MMHDSIMDGLINTCMIASTLFALVILVLVVIETVVQAGILSEIRRRIAANVTGRKDADRS